MVWILEKLDHKTDIVLPMTILVVSIVELASGYILSYYQGLMNFQDILP